jgi:Ca2+-binding RTX toxin-like protein
MAEPIRIEAEAMTQVNYNIESGNSFASSNALIKLRTASLTGTASFAFEGLTGTYDVILGYIDENDGIAKLEVTVGDTSLAAWDLNQALGNSGASVQTLVRRTVASGVSINQGQTIQIRGTANQGEAARVDYIELIPVSIINGTNAAETLTGNALKNTIKGFGGNDILAGQEGSDILDGGTGADRVSYRDAARGVIVNLAQGFAFTSAYNTPLKIMPLGDSITKGVLGESTYYDNDSSGGYRTGLWNRFVADGLKVDFVGSQSHGPTSLSDRDHQGHGGWTMNQIAGSVNGWLNTSQPDVTLLMIGTNDARTDSVSTMINELSTLIDQVTTQSPNTQLLVASIPPIYPNEQPATRIQRAKDFNIAIPGIVNSKIAQGKKVNFVDMRSLTLNDLTSSISPELDNGLHPNVQGYGKIANFWHDAVLNTAGDKDTLLGIESVIGSNFDDKLTGTTGPNLFDGGSGRDTITGGRGADVFVYMAPSEGLDTITDFGGNDFFRISASGFGGGLSEGTALSTTDSTTGVFASSIDPTATGTSANFLYNTSTGLLNFDSDGTGSGEALAIVTLTGAPSLSANQFVIIT